MIQPGVGQHSALNGIKVRVFFWKKTSEKSTCAVMIRIIITFVVFLAFFISDKIVVFFNLPAKYKN